MADSLDFASLSIKEGTSPVEVEVKNITLSASVKFIEDANVMIIMRGVPGSGKSTIVKYLMAAYGTNCVCSADDFFMKNGHYNFDAKNLQQAHQYCQHKAEKFCKEGHSVVIADNTNVKKWETDFYVDLAHRCGYIVIMITPQAQKTTGVEILARRNKHGVPADVIRKKISMFSVIHPSYFAWFLSKRSTLKLADLREAELAKFRDKGFFDVHFTNKNAIYHVTSIFLGRMNGTEELEAKLTQHIGKVAYIKVTAIVITKRTIAARVQLDKEAEKYYFNDESSGNNKLEEHQGYGLLNKGHAAHITLGTAEGIEAKIARGDMTLSHLCAANQLEAPPLCKEKTTFYPNENLAVVTLDKPMVFSTMFAAGYH